MFTRSRGQARSALGLVFSLLAAGRAQAAALVFGSPFVLNSDAATDIYEDTGGQLAADGAGHVVAGWVSNKPRGDIQRNLFVARSSDHGATWTAPAPLNGAPSTSTDDAPQIATDRLGTWVAVWTARGGLGGTLGNDPDILAARSTDNGATW